MQLIRGIFSLLGGILILSSDVKATHLSKLNPVATKCFHAQKPETCQKALMITDDLQWEAGEQSNYPCQTLALGLGADLIMSQDKAGRGRRAVELLKQLNETCDGL